jgi:hypothetical protein
MRVQETAHAPNDSTSLNLCTDDAQRLDMDSASRVAEIGSDRTPPGGLHPYNQMPEHLIIVLEKLS